MAEQKPQRTEFSQIGHRAAVARLFEGSGYTNSPEIKIADGIASHKLMAQGVDFDLVYNPLKHLGYKAVLNVLGEIYAAFYRPRALSLAAAFASILPPP